MSKLPNLSGFAIIKILTKNFGFEIAGQRGSHVKLRRYINGRKVVTIVPLHKEVKTGTLIGVLDLGEVDREEFMEFE